MSAKKSPVTLASLRLAVANAEAALGGLRSRLAKLEAAERGESVPVCGLDLLWTAALPMARQRSSKQLCRKAWAAIPSAARPTVQQAIEALKLWNRCDQWKSNDNIYVPGLHRYISARMWECPPEAPKVKSHRGMTPSRPLPENHGEGVTDPAEIARLLDMKPNPYLHPHHD